MTRARPEIQVAAMPGGWPRPWPAVAELAAELGPENWSLIGGLMTQLHTTHHGIGVTRPTNDVDINVHIGTRRGVPRAVADTLEKLGYVLKPGIDVRNRSAHRFVRGDQTIDIVSAPDAIDQVDVVIADHPAPSVVERMRGHDMVRIAGGTQALRRTINAIMELEPGQVSTISVPSAFGALILKAAAFVTDSRDRERHLFDAAALLACIDDPFVARLEFSGSDRHRIAVLKSHHPAWLALPSHHRWQGRMALDILSSTDSQDPRGLDEVRAA